MTITVYKQADETLKPFYTTVDKALDAIRTGKYADKITLVRGEQDKKKRASLKEKLPCIIWSGKFTERRDECQLEHSGLAVLDFDHLSDVADKKLELTFKPFIYAAFISPSGDGIKALAKIPKDIEKHSGYYRGLLAEFPELDSTSRNKSRVCFTSWDADIYINENAIEFTEYVPLPPPKPIQPIGSYHGTDYIKMAIPVKMIAESLEGEKHETLLRASRLMGGFIAGGYVGEAEGVWILENAISSKEGVEDFEQAKKTIKDGIEYGKKEPIADEIEYKNYIPPKNSGLKPIDGVWDEMIHSFRHGQERGKTTHFRPFDENWTWKSGEITLIIARPNAGKTEFALHLMLLKSIFEGWKWGVFSPENYPVKEFFDTLIHSYIGKTTDKYWGVAQMSEAEYERGYNFVKKHFFYVYPESHKAEEIQSNFLYLIENEGINGTFTDPYNQLEVEFGAREDVFLSNFLRERKRFALKHNIHDIISAHPKTMHRNKNGDYEIPDMYDIAGGAMWGNKADNIIVLHRPNFLTDPADTTVEVHVRKIKKQKLVGIPGMCKFNFLRKTNRYYINEANPLENNQTIEHPNNK